MRFIGSILLVTLALTTRAQAADVSLSAIEGRWGRDNCSFYLHTFGFTPNKQFLQLEDEQGIQYYYVVGPTKRGYKVVLLGEDRLDAKGNPVSWYIVFHNNKSFSWLRSDRKSDDLRGPVVRCE
jgi:hypothetical protein